MSWKQYIVATIFYLSFLNGQIIDSDLDGVEDRFDKCPDTPFFTLVDRNGCKIKELNGSNFQKVKYRAVLGYILIDDGEESYSSNFLNFIIDYKDYSLVFDTSITNFEDREKFDDISITLFYQNSFKSLNYSFEVGAYIPIDSNFKGDRADYFINFELSFRYKSLRYFLYLQRNFNQDLDSKDLNSYSIGANYTTNSYLISISYRKNDQIGDKKGDSSYIISSFTYYIDLDIFLTLNYSRGLNSSSIDKTTLISIGYNF